MGKIGIKSKISAGMILRVREYLEIKDWQVVFFNCWGRQHGKDCPIPTVPPNFIGRDSSVRVTEINGEDAIISMVSPAEECKIPAVHGDILALPIDVLERWRRA